MSIDRRHISVGGLEVEVIRKDIKNLHLGVYPPNGRVRVAVPRRVNDSAVRVAVVSRLGWIKRQRAEFASQRRESPREMVSGESHYFLGKRYRLRVIKEKGTSKVVLRSRSFLELHVRPELTVCQKEQALLRWYRVQLRQLIPPLIEKWQPILGVNVAEWGIKKMKTRWGTCNIGARRIWLNLELSKKPSCCLEYVLVHEMTHLLERHHNDAFRRILDRHMPRWREYREKLAREPLAHEEWTC